MKLSYQHSSVGRLVDAGFSLDDAMALRRISMTLQRWFELECGDGNSYGSWAIERDDNGDGPAFLVHHHYLHGRGKDYTTRTKIADREAGAKRRLAKIMARYPAFQAYVQGDPRGCALYILPPELLARLPDGVNGDVGSIYSSGIAVHR